ncbi:hornerin-like [Echinops telfairi]|uniref:Hornerin-like n=1 Tax=Echinops telfairi TaxID=9371 RepID=A0AC55DIQ6_ECHTE|nr:hornerin-like [Echinops telfairi]
MSKLLQSIVSTIETYYQYATQEEECSMLNKAELKELLENEFRQILKNPDDPDTVDVIMQSLDRDHNRKVDFTEFLVMIFKLAQACNKIIGKDYCQASGSNQRNHGYQHQEEQRETEEEGNGEESSSSRSSWNSKGSSRSIRHKAGSSSRRVENQDDFSNFEHRQSPWEKIESSSKGSGFGSGSCREQYHWSDSNESTGCGQHKFSSGSCGGQDHWSDSNESTGCGQHRFCPSQPSQKEWPKSNSGSQSQNCEEQGYHSSSSESSSYRTHGSNSGQSSSQRTRGSSSISHSGGWKKETHGSGSGQSSSWGQQGSSSGQCSSYSPYASGSGQSSSYSHNVCNSGQSSCHGQQGSHSGPSSGSDQCASGLGLSSSCSSQRSRSGQSSICNQQGSSESHSSSCDEYGSCSRQSSSCSQQGRCRSSSRESCDNKPCVGSNPNQSGRNCQEWPGNYQKEGSTSHSLSGNESNCHESIHGPSGVCRQQHQEFGQGQWESNCGHSICGEGQSGRSYEQVESSSSCSYGQSIPCYGQSGPNTFLTNNELYRHCRYMKESNCGRGSTGPSSHSFCSSTPLYKYVQEQRCYF